MTLSGVSDSTFLGCRHRQFVGWLVQVVVAFHGWAMMPAHGQVSVTMGVNAYDVLTTMPGVGIGLHTSVYSNNFAQPTLPGKLGAGGIQMLRYPGGNYADIYHWTSHTATPNGYAASTSHFGNFVDLLMDGSGATGMISINYGNSHLGTEPGQPMEAAAWVAYANGDPSDTRVIGVDDEGNDWRTVGYWATLRGRTPAQNPDNQYDFLAINHDDPLGIQYWEIGNELNGNGFYGTNYDWQYDLHEPYQNGVSCGMNCTDYPDRVGYPGGAGYSGGADSGGLGPEDYGANFIEFHDAMKFVDPTIQIGAVLVGTGVGDTAEPAYNWDRQVMQSAGEYMDFGSYHFYPSGGTDAVLNATDDLPAEFDLLRDRMDTYIHPGASEEIEIHMTEFGYFGSVASPAINGVYAANTYATALEDGATSVHWLEMSASSYVGDNVPVEGPAYHGVRIFSEIAEAGAEFVDTDSSNGNVETHATVLPDGSIGLLITNVYNNAARDANVTVNIIGALVGESGTSWLYGVNQTTPLETNIGSGLGNSFTVFVPYRSILALVIPAQAALPGDYNYDGIVDGADYTVWRDSLGDISPDLAADGSGPGGVPDGVVDEYDFDLWRANFGETSPPGSGGGSTAVPEPSTALLACLACVGWMAANRRRSQKATNLHRLHG